VIDRLIIFYSKNVIWYFKKTAVPTTTTITTETAAAATVANLAFRFDLIYLS